MGYSFKTFLKHTAKDFHNQSVNPPVVRASTIIFKSMQDIRKTQKRSFKDPKISSSPERPNEKFPRRIKLKPPKRKLEIGINTINATINEMT